MDQTPKALGIAGIGLGALTSLTSAFGLVAQSLMKDLVGAFGRWADQLPARPGQPRMGDMMDRTAEAMELTRPYQIAQSSGMLVLSVALLVIGIAILQHKPWSRKAAMGWAGVALAFVPVMIWIQAGVIQPMTQQAVYQAMPPAQVAAQAQFQGFIRSFQAAATAAGTLAFYAPFPILLLALLRREKAKAWFGPAPEPEPESGPSA